MVPRPAIEVLEEISGRYPNTILESYLDPRGFSMTVSDVLKALRADPLAISLRLKHQNALNPIWIWWEHAGVVYMAPIDENLLTAGRAEA